MSPARERIDALIAAARRVADPRDVLGHEARRALPAVTGLSPEGVALALERCLEVSPSETELEALCASVAPAPAAHVLLSANVFVAAHRAVALALAASEHVLVRPSRREPQFAELLARGAPGLFQLVTELEPRPGDHVYAYGRDETLAALEARMPAGVVLHGHGTGFSIALAGAAADPAMVAERLALDIALFDQRGCLSPRALLVVGAPAAPYAQALASALTELEQRVPVGGLSPEERAAVTSYRDSMTFSAEVLAAGSGFVSFEDACERLLIAPVGRNCHVAACSDPLALLQGQRDALTSVGLAGEGAWRDALAAALPGARLTAIGTLQTPPFDGPVDRRGR
ncbi:MAG TPA: acyl-CoA reductase [Polyangiaceae bacterium]|nr:acyl-CoA reductase [Polyangiaceae bacterium]